MKTSLKTIISLLMALAMTSHAGAQLSQDDGTVVVQSLFAYPEAPTYLDNLNAKCDYLMDNFWNDMNFKQKVVNQAALQHAFSVYAAPMQWASKAKVISSVQALLKKVEKNPSLATQIMKAAEETFHSPRSEVYIDEVYRIFLEAYINNKKVKKERKTKYKTQLEAIIKSAPGEVAPRIELTDSIGHPAELKHGRLFSIIIFGTRDSDELRRVLLHVGLQVTVEKMCRNGDLSLNFVCLDEPSAENDEYIKTLPEVINSGYADRQSLMFDIRRNPSVYLLDEQKRIILNDTNIDNVLEAISRIMATTLRSNPEDKK